MSIELVCPEEASTYIVPGSHGEEYMEPRNFKTVRSMDLHGNCYDDLVDYLDGVKREARKVRAIATIADEGVPANGGPGR